ncbi:unnamed protein product [Dibothriocephalus latus]|uniref:Reverse transcriptase domain-containing protein n=1 Tax=Dibothriocephalus latus TaxID=60516 RepID=A0A3P6R2M6_DIBLA|nr:unnamed protein product [Dibothriocephalus latus]
MQVKAGSLATSDYPIPLLIALATILERLLHPILTSAGNLSSYQQCHRSGRDTPRTLFELSDAILEGFNQQKPALGTTAVLIDLSRAFDCVLWDLVSLNIPTGLVQWLAAYIRGHHDRVLFRGAISKHPRVNDLGRQVVRHCFTLHPKWFNRHAVINVNGASLPLVRKPKQLGIRFDPLFTFADHAMEVAAAVMSLGLLRAHPGAA